MSAQARKGARIRKGGPGEELALAEHLAGLAPTPQRLAEAGALAEALVCCRFCCCYCSCWYHAEQLPTALKVIAARERALERCCS